MDTTSVAPTTLTREARGLRLFREHGEGIEMIAPDFYLCPSEGGARFYHVDLVHETCDCDDFRRHGASFACKHIYAVGISRAKRRAKGSRCAGCGDKFPAAGLLEIGDEHVAHGLGVLEGERYCRSCACRRGIL